MDSRRSWRSRVYSLSEDPSPPDPTTLTDKDRASLYVDMWKQTVTVQQHFNDIEWRIRGLALTAATFSVGAAGLAVNNGHPFPGAVILAVGLVLWYAFYFVDRYWYHPLLVASVLQGHAVEDKIEQVGLPGAALTRAISAGSPIDRPRVIRLFTRKNNRDTQLRSEGKLVWFYRIGALALAGAAIGFLMAALHGAFLADSRETPPTIVQIEPPFPAPETSTATPSPTPTPQPTPSLKPDSRPGTPAPATTR